jgi:hypothetical protein
MASAFGLVILVTTFLAIRVYLKKKRKKTISNGILSQLGISQKAPDFTIPLMMPMLIQDKLSSDGEVFDPICDTWPMGTNSPSLIQPDRYYEDREGGEVRYFSLLTSLQFTIPRAILESNQAFDSNRGWTELTLQ